MREQFRTTNTPEQAAGPLLAAFVLWIIFAAALAVKTAAAPGVHTVLPGFAGRCRALVGWERLYREHEGLRPFVTAPLLPW